MGDNVEGGMMNSILEDRIGPGEALMLVMILAL